MQLLLLISLIPKNDRLNIFQNNCYWSIGHHVYRQVCVFSFPGIKVLQMGNILGNVEVGGGGGGGVNNYWGGYNSNINNLNIKSGNGASGDPHFHSQNSRRAKALDRANSFSLLEPFISSVSDNQARYDWRWMLNPTLFFFIFI